jgi:hypothetical protein
MRSWGASSARRCDSARASSSRRISREPANKRAEVGAPRAALETWGFSPGFEKRGRGALSGVAPVRERVAEQHLAVTSLLSVSRFIMWFTLTSCDPSRKSPLTILPGRISMPRQESTPHKVRVNQKNNPCPSDGISQTFVFEVHLSFCKVEPRQLNRHQERVCQRLLNSRRSCKTSWPIIGVRRSGCGELLRNLLRGYCRHTSARYNQA